MVWKILGGFLFENGCAFDVRFWHLADMSIAAPNVRVGAKAQDHLTRMAASNPCRAVGELEECLRHLDKAGFVNRVLETRSERHALGGIPTIFVCCRQARPASRTEQ